MTQVPPSPMIALDDEKTPRLQEEVIEEDVSSSDGDDALKLAGTHAHHFDEKYYTRLRRKIVSHHSLGYQDQQLSLL